MQSQLSNGALISPEYRALNAELHERKVGYGINGHRHAEAVEGLAFAMNARTILDYGCGQGSLAKAIKNKTVIGYDPAVAQFSSAPEPADLLACCDVLEHIEPDLLENVLDHMRSLAHRAVYLSVATRPAKKTLADGRNAHLIQEPLEWWMPRLMHRWYMTACTRDPGNFLFVGMAK